MLRFSGELSCPRERAQPTRCYGDIHHIILAARRQATPIELSNAIGLGVL